MEHETVSVEDLKICLQSSWRKETSNDVQHWTPQNPAWGQCAVTALVAQDFFGGEIKRLDLRQAPDEYIAGMGSHYFNVMDGTNVDFSENQFPGNAHYYEKLLTPENISIKTREYLLSNRDTKTRYEILRLAVAKNFAQDNPLFSDPIYRECLRLALNSDCKKGNYGCVALHERKIIARSENHVMELLRNWCSPECVRLQIPSRTESMIGACAHAEELAIRAVYHLGIRTSEVSFYVAGFRSNGLTYIKPEPEFTCLRCAVQFYLHGAHLIYVPSKTQWAGLTTAEAIKSARDFATQTKSLRNF